MMSQESKQHYLALKQCRYCSAHRPLAEDPKHPGKFLSSCRVCRDVHNDYRRKGPMPPKKAKNEDSSSVWACPETDLDRAIALAGKDLDD